MITMIISSALFSDDITILSAELGCPYCCTSCKSVGWEDMTQNRMCVYYFLNRTTNVLERSVALPLSPVADLGLALPLSPVADLGCCE